MTGSSAARAHATRYRLNGGTQRYAGERERRCSCDDGGDCPETTTRLLHWQAEAPSHPDSPSPVIRYSGAAGDDLWSQLVEIEARLQAINRVACFLEQKGAHGWAQWLRDDLESIQTILNDAGADQIIGAGGGGRQGIRLGSRRYATWRSEDWTAAISFYESRNFDVALELRAIYWAARGTKGRELVFEEVAR